MARELIFGLDRGENEEVVNQQILVWVLSLRLDTMVSRMFPFVKKS